MTEFAAILHGFAEVLTAAGLLWRVESNHRRGKAKHRELDAKIRKLQGEEPAIGKLPVRRKRK